MAEQEKQLWPVAEQGQTLVSDWPAAAWSGLGAPRPRGQEGGGPPSREAGGKTGWVWERWGEGPPAWAPEQKRTDWASVKQTTT